MSPGDLCGGGISVVRVPPMWQRGIEKRGWKTYRAGLGESEAGDDRQAGTMFLTALVECGSR